MKDQKVFVDSVVPSVKDLAKDKTFEELLELFTNEQKETFKHCDRVFGHCCPVFIEKYDLESLKNWMKYAIEAEEGNLATNCDWLGTMEWTYSYLNTGDISFLKLESNGAELKILLADTTTLILQSKEVEDLTKYVLELSANHEM